MTTPTYDPIAIIRPNADLLRRIEQMIIDARKADRS